MQHIIQFAFDFEDEKVARSIEQNVETKVIQNIEKEIKDKYFNRRWNENPIDGLVTGTVNKIVEENKEEIIKRASQLLCDKVYRSKAFKTAKDEILQAASDTE